MGDEEFSALLVVMSAMAGVPSKYCSRGPPGANSIKIDAGSSAWLRNPCRPPGGTYRKSPTVASACGVIGRGGVRTGDLSPVAGALAIGSAITGLLTPLYLVRAPRPGHGPHPHRPTPTTSRQLNRNRDVCTAEGSQVRILPTAWLLRMCHQRSAPNSCP